MNAKVGIARSATFRRTTVESVLDLQETHRISVSVSMDFSRMMITFVEVIIKFSSKITYFFSLLKRVPTTM